MRLGRCCTSLTSTRIGWSSSFAVQVERGEPLTHRTSDAETTPGTSLSSDRADRLWLGLLVVASIAVCAVFAWRRAAPDEDAAILYRYADNLAHGHGVVWNPGDAPVDGATDLLFMVALAVLRVGGLGIKTAALLVNTVAFVGTVCLLYVFARHRRLPIWFATLACAVYALGPGVVLMRTGFGAVTFGFAVGVSAVLAIRLIEQATTRRALELALSIVVAGLVRPEGFLLGGLLLLTVVAVTGRRGLRPVANAFLVVVGAGLVFLVVRWRYFGYPLPNPYYKKGGGTLHSDGIEASATFAVTICLVPLLAIAAAVLDARVRRMWLAFVGCLLAMLALWVLLSNEANLLYRFQFPVFVVAIVFAVELWSREYQHQDEASDRSWDRSRMLVVGTVVLLLLVNVHYVYSKEILSDRAQRTFATTLAKFDSAGLTVASSEAGHVCWESGWHCIDLWGLNDEQIAHHGYLDRAQLTALAPDVVFIHVPTSPIATSVTAGDEEFISGWTDMSTPVIDFVEHGNYALVAMLEPKLDSGYAVYVRTGRPKTDRLIAAFSKLQPTLRHSYGPSPTDRYSLPTGS